MALNIGLIHIFISQVEGEQKRRCSLKNTCRKWRFQIMARVFNFSAGPSMLPELVLQQAAADMLDYKGSGQSVMEMSHRSPEFEKIIADCESLLRELLSIPDNYKVIFMQGGASSQFAMIPLNLMNGSGKADYLVTGQFSKKAAAEAKKYGQVNVVASSADANFSFIPEAGSYSFTPDADYVHICYNNTIYGSHFNYIPDTGDIPLVADMSSSIMSEPVDVSKFGVIYAGAQKNMAPAGLTIVIIREDLLGKAREGTPVMFDYKEQAEAGSMYNTPPCWPIYICGLVMEWVKNTIGGVDKMHEHNQKKAAVLYNYLDKSKLFKAVVKKEDRSLMNVTFVTGDKDLDKAFVGYCRENGLLNINGHRSVGGMRASIYNAMPIEGVEKLVSLMERFEKEHV